MHSRGVNVVLNSSSLSHYPYTAGIRKQATDMCFRRITAAIVDL